MNPLLQTAKEQARSFDVIANSSDIRLTHPVRIDTLKPVGILISFRISIVEYGELERIGHNLPLGLILKPETQTIQPNSAATGHIFY